MRREEEKEVNAGRSKRRGDTGKIEEEPKRSSKGEDAKA